MTSMSVSRARRAAIASAVTGLAAACGLLAAFGGQALADGKIDRSIDAAAARIVAARIGDLRGGFAPGDEPVFVTGEDPRVTAALPARPGVFVDGLALARDPLARPGERYGL